MLPKVFLAVNKSRLPPCLFRHRGSLFSIAKFFSMKAPLLLCAGCLTTLVACSGLGRTAIYHPDVGPFDENGDYVVALADAPVKKNDFSRSSKVKKTQPKRPSKQQQVAQVPKTVQPPKLASRTQPTARAVGRTSGPVLIAQSPRQSRPSAIAQPKPQPKVVKAKPKPKLKPKAKGPVRHVVRKSDTLYGLSRKYGVSVGAIQRANRLRGTTIITGRTLSIPR